MDNKTVIAELLEGYEQAEAFSQTQDNIIDRLISSDSLSLKVKSLDKDCLSESIDLIGVVGQECV